MRFPAIRILLGIALGLALSCCGGGSSGTDGGFGRGAVIKGTVHDNLGNPIPDAQITLIQTGDSVTSDALGTFNLPTSFVGGGPLLEVDRDGTTGQIEIQSTLDEQSIVTVELSVDSTGSIVINSLEITERPPLPGTPSPVPSPSSSPGATPTPLMPTIIQGTLRDSLVVPLRGARVTISGAAQSSVADERGHFSVERPTRAGDATLRITYRGIVYKTTIRNLPARSVIVTLEITVITEGVPTDIRPLVEIRKRNEAPRI